MARTTHGPDQGEAAEAFAAILTAERAAESAVAACRDAAERRLADAHSVAATQRERSMALLERWEQARQRQTAAYAAEVAEQVTRLGEPLGDVPDLLLELSPELAAAVARLADELIGD